MVDSHFLYCSLNASIILQMYMSKPKCGIGHRLHMCATQYYASLSRFWMDCASTSCCYNITWRNLMGVCPPYISKTSDHAHSYTYNSCLRDSTFQFITHVRPLHEVVSLRYYPYPLSECKDPYLKSSLNIKLYAPIL